MDDAALLALSQQMAERDGQIPTIEQLVAESGGCQRQRAVVTLRQLREKQARLAVQSHLRLPAALEAEVRELLVRWLTIAADQFSTREATSTLEADNQRHALERQIEELISRNRELQTRIDQLDKGIELRQEEIHSLRTLTESLRSERDAARATAEERDRMLDRLLRGSDSSVRV